MKSRLTILLLIAAAATSCLGDPVGSYRKDQQIGFATKLGSRAAVTTDAEMLAAAGGFTVWVYGQQQTLWAVTPNASKTPLLPEATTVTGTDDGSGIVWSYGEPVMWPSNQYVSFFACGPAGAATNGGKTPGGVPIIDYTASTTVLNQADLLVASPLFDQTAPTYPFGQPVNLTFNHALSKISFSGVLTNEDETRTIKVKKIVLNGIYNSGSTALAPVSWTLGGTRANYTVQAPAQLKADTPLAYPGATGITTETGYLFLLPQTLARGNGDDPTMDVTLDVDGVETAYSSLLFSPGEWLPGKSYNYQIIVDGDDIDVIVIDSDLTLEPWNSYLSIQPISLIGIQDKDIARINSGLTAFAYLNNPPAPDPMVDNIKYCGLYLKNDIQDNLTISMDPYDSGFTTGESVMFDAKKMIGIWGNDGTDNYTLTVTFNAGAWELTPSAQPVYDPVDGWTYATTQTPSNQINNKGSIILKRK